MYGESEQIAGQNYTYRDAFDLVSTVYSPCGVASNLYIQNDIRVSNSRNPSGNGYISADAVSATISYNLISVYVLTRSIHSSLQVFKFHSETRSMATNHVIFAIRPSTSNGRSVYDILQ